VTDLLTVKGLNGGYGASQVLFELGLQIGIGEVATLLGRNGMGKTTTVRAILGLLKGATGSVMLNGVEVLGKRAYKIAREGIGIVPEGREIFATLTVRENLIATARSVKVPGAYDFDSVCEMFPRLRERQNNLGWQLSGGEQQMLAIARALMTNPRLLILDEATEGLAPTVRIDIWRCLNQLRARGMSMLIIDKNLKSLIEIADRHYMIEKGKIAWFGTSSDLLRQRLIINRYLAVQ
jgi:branched-chain amino acid transport system ATP-binding protein